MDKLLFVDLETTGLPDNPDAVTLAVGMIFDNGDQSDAFQVVICPTPEQYEKASAEALKVNGFTTYDKLLAEGIDELTAKATTLNWLYEHGVGSDTLYVGQNIKFDFHFLKKLMGVELDYMDFPFNRAADTLVMAKKLANLDRSIVFPNFKGWGISRALGIEEEGSLHLALGGAESARRNFYALAERLQKFGVEVRNGYC